MIINRFEKVFGKGSRVLLPVIHTINPHQVIDSVSCVMDNGADGFFLINQSMDAMEIVKLLPRVARYWVGINLLGSSLDTVISLAGEYAKGIWTDDVSSFDLSDMGHRVREGDESWAGLWFGGTCFKYSGHETDPPAPHITRQHGLVDVVTTSGPATGIAASATKIKAFREALRDRPLGLASGVTPENVIEYPQVDAFLVATGIEKHFGTFDPKKVRDLADKIHAGEK